MRPERGIGLAAVLFLSLLSLAGCRLDQVAAQQEKATGLWDELVAGHSYGQTFVSAEEDLYRIDVSMATYARTNRAPVVFHLRSGPEAAADLVTITRPGPEVENERPTSFRFEPLAGSRGAAYYFFLESPGAAPGNAITVYANDADGYPGGTAFRDGGAVAGDLAFTAYSRRTFSAAGVLGEFLARLAGDVPFLVCYGVLIGAACAGLVLARRRAAPTK